jgi:hypothetical protein
LARELGLVCRLLASGRFQLQGRQLHFAAHLTKISRSQCPCMFTV